METFFLDTGFLSDDVCWDDNFGNAGDVRNFFERSVDVQFDRVTFLEERT